MTTPTTAAVIKPTTLPGQSLPTPPLWAVGAYYDDYAVLACPFCGDRWTHVNEVSAGVPDKYDEATTHTHVTFDATTGRQRGGTRTTAARVGFSLRRHFLELHIDCEICDGGSIVFGQHKGETRVWLLPAGHEASARTDSAEE